MRQVARWAIVLIALTPIVAHAQPNVPVDPWGPAPPPPPPPPAPAPANPAPTDPAPTNPAPTNPAPTNPAPTNPAPTNPAPTTPPPVDPPPVDPPPPVDATPPGPVEPPAPRTSDELTPEELAAATTPIEAPTTRPEGYPLSLPARPLILPDGSWNGSVSLALFHIARPQLSAVTSSIHAGAAHVIGRTEIGVDADFTVFDDQDAPAGQELRFVTVNGVGLAFRQGVGEDTALGTGLAIRAPGTDYQGWSTGLSVQRKGHVSPRAAILVGAGLDYENAIYEDRDQQRFVPYGHVGVYASLAVEANVAPRVNLFAITSVTQNELLDDLDGEYEDDILTSFRSYTSRIALVLAPNDMLDVWINLTIHSTGGYDTKSLAVVFDVRRLP